MQARTAVREITYDYTVRKLLPAFELDGAKGASFSKELTIDLDDSWALNHVWRRRVHSGPDVALYRRCQLQVPNRQELIPAVTSRSLHHSN